MKMKLSVEDVKQIELDMLCYIDEICRENGITYYLAGGTLLGAIRHKGFIPWDDDIDIHMTRDDYNKFKKLLNTSEYKLLEPGDNGYYYNFSKFIDCRTRLVENDYKVIEDMGVYIDIFYLDNLPGDYNEAMNYYKKLESIRRKINYFSVPKPTLKGGWVKLIKSCVTHLQLKMYNLEKLQQKYKKEVGTFKRERFCCATGGAWKEKEVYLNEWFDSIVEVEFEGHRFYAPRDYDIILNQLYGNYMELPPVEKRKSHHNFDAYNR